MNKYEQLIVWKVAVQFTKDIYILCDKLPSKEERIIIEQIKRATISIVLNIGEGSGAESDSEFKRFLLIAKKSAFEVNTALQLVEELYRIDTGPLQQKVVLIIKLLNGLIKFLKGVPSVVHRP